MKELKQVLDLSYTDFCRIKDRYMAINERLEHIENFLKEFTKYVTLKGQKHENLQ